MKSLEQLYKQGALAAESDAQTVFVGGCVESGGQRAGSAATAANAEDLEEKGKIVQLLEAYLDVKQEAVRVVIGLDEVALHEQLRAHRRAGSGGQLK